MSIDFNSLLSDSQKRSILEQRIQQFAIEAYQYQINKDFSKKIGNDDGVSQAEVALTNLETAIKFHQDEMSKLSDI